MNNQTFTEAKTQTSTETNNSFKKIGIFPGFFNPIHNGQLIAAEQIIDRYQLDAIFFCLLDDEDDPQARIQMIQLATNSNSKFKIDSQIYQNNQKMVNNYIEIYPDAEIFVIAGAKKIQQTKNFKFNNHDQVKIIGLVEPKITRNKELAVEWFKFPRLEISGKVIRNNLQNYQTVRYLIPDLIAVYIAEYNLYKEDK